MSGQDWIYSVIYLSVRVCVCVCVYLLDGMSDDQPVLLNSQLE